jgi:hypothetical protein
LPSGSEGDPVLFSSGANVEERGVKVESLLIDWSGTTVAERLNSAFQLNKCTEVLAVMNIEVRHVPLEKEEVLDRCHPLIVPDPLRGLPSLTSDVQVPVVAIAPQAYVFDRIPKVLPEARVAQEAPVLVSPY